MSATFVSTDHTMTPTECFSVMQSVYVTASASALCYLYFCTVLLVLLYRLIGTFVRYQWSYSCHCTVPGMLPVLLVPLSALKTLVSTPKVLIDLYPAARILLMESDTLRLWDTVFTP